MIKIIRECDICLSNKYVRYETKDNDVICERCISDFDIDIDEEEKS